MTSIVAVYRRWPTQEAALNHLATVRWGDKPRCYFCQAETVCRKAEPHQRATWQCWSCEKSFSATSGAGLGNAPPYGMEHDAPYQGRDG